jgi:hypothetical protein
MVLHDVGERLRVRARLDRLAGLELAVRQLLGVLATTALLHGDTVGEIVFFADSRNVDLIASGLADAARS